MKLKILEVVFQDMNDFFAEVDRALNSGRRAITKGRNVLRFDSVKTFNNVMTVNKIQILRAISQLKPESVYQLAMMLHREPHHVLKDCRQLESYKFIKLEETDSARSSLRPVLTFNYDVIKADSPIISPYTISERSERFLLGRQIET